MRLLESRRLIIRCDQPSAVQRKGPVWCLVQGFRIPATIGLTPRAGGWRPKTAQARNRVGRSGEIGLEGSILRSAIQSRACLLWVQNENLPRSGLCQLSPAADMRPRQRARGWNFPVLAYYWSKIEGRISSSVNRLKPLDRQVWV
jgi:hypothetical protein